MFNVLTKFHGIPFFNFCIIKKTKTWNMVINMYHTVSLRSERLSCRRLRLVSESAMTSDLCDLPHSANTDQGKSPKVFLYLLIYPSFVLDVWMWRMELLWMFFFQWNFRLCPSDEIPVNPLLCVIQCLSTGGRCVVCNDVILRFHSGAHVCSQVEDLKRKKKTD